MPLHVVGQHPTIDSLPKFIAAEWKTIARPKIDINKGGYFII